MIIFIDFFFPQKLLCLPVYQLVAPALLAYSETLCNSNRLCIDLLIINLFKSERPWQMSPELTTYAIVYQSTHRAKIRLAQCCKYSFSAGQYGDEYAVMLIPAWKSQLLKNYLYESRRRTDKV